MKQIAKRVLVAVLGSILMGVPAMAQDELNELYLDQSLGKLGRGLANVVTAPGEIFRMVEIVGREEGYVGGISEGILRGLGRTGLRAGAGVVELFTFYAPWPNDFGPIIEPEYVFAHGSWSQND